VNAPKRPLALSVVLTVGVAAVVAVTAAQSANADPGPATPQTASTLAAQKATELVAGQPAYLMAGANEQFVRGQVISSGATQYVPFSRTYGGLPVVGGDFVMMFNGAGQNIANSVAMEHPLGAVPRIPALSAKDAEAVAAKQLTTVAAVEGSQLVVDALGATARLAWATTVNGTGPDGASRLTVDVDAFTGAVLDSTEHVAHGTGTGVWNGPNPVSLNTTSAGGTFTMKDPNITNQSCQNSATNTTFSGPDDVWGNGNATDRETGCVDTLFAAQAEFRMLSQWLGRSGFDGAGGGWPLRVGLNDVNAGYDGVQVQIGHNTAGQWIGAIDVVAH